MSPEDPSPKEVMRDELAEILARVYEKVFRDEGYSVGIFGGASVKSAPVMLVLAVGDEPCKAMSKILEDWTAEHSEQASAEIYMVNRNTGERSPMEGTFTEYFEKNTPKEGESAEEFFRRRAAEDSEGDEV